MELSGKLTTLTGASRGIGRALAVELARSGCRLLLTALEGDELAALSQEIRRSFSVNVLSHDREGKSGRWIARKKQILRIADNIEKLILILNR